MNLKRGVPFIITLITGTVLVLEFFFSGIKGVKQIFLDWVQIIAAFAMLLGILNLLYVHLKKITKLASVEVIYSVVLVSGLLITAFYGIFLGKDNNVFKNIFSNVYTPLSATMFSLLAFFIASAAYRAFRAKNREASLLLVTATFVMLGVVPLGDVIWKKIFPSGFILLSDISTWIMAYINTAGQRAILIGSALGAIAISIKILAGIEKSYLGGE